MGNIIDSFDHRFSTLHARSRELITQIDDESLYRKPRQIEHSMTMFSCGEYILRSAATVEQTCGGLTTRLWDDPFEWTLPEKLSERIDVLGYLDEVEQTRHKCFTFFTADEDLLKQVPSPEKIRPIFDLLLETIAKAEHFQGRAFSLFQVWSDKKLPRI